MKTAELKKLNHGELEEKLKQFEADLFQLKMKKATGQLEKGMQLAILRKDIARIKCLLHLPSILGLRKKAQEKVAVVRKELTKGACGTPSRSQIVKSSRSALVSEIKKIRAEISNKINPELLARLSLLSRELGKVSRDSKGKTPKVAKIGVRVKQLKASGGTAISNRDVKFLDQAPEKISVVKEIRELKTKKRSLLARVAELQGMVRQVVKKLAVSEAAK